MKASKWVLFDMHDTLVSSSIYMSLYAPLITRLVSDKGISFTRLNTEINRIKKLKETTRADTYEVCESFNALDLYYQEFAKHLTATPARTDVAKLFDAVREMGMRIGIVSNDHARTLRLLLEHHNLADFVDFIFCFEHGGEKNSLVFWKKLCDAHNIEPDEAIVIDNDQKAIDNAKVSGFKTIKVDGLIDYTLLGRIH